MYSRNICLRNILKYSVGDLSLPPAMRLGTFAEVEALGGLMSRSSRGRHRVILDKCVEGHKVRLMGIAWVLCHSCHVSVS